MTEALKEKDLQLLIALWTYGSWMKLPGSLQITVSGEGLRRDSCTTLKIRDVKRLCALGYAETLATQVVMNMATGKTHRVKSDSFRITKLGIMRLMNPGHVVVTEVMEG